MTNQKKGNLKHMRTQAELIRINEISSVSVSALPVSHSFSITHVCAIEVYVVTSIV